MSKLEHAEGFQRRIEQNALLIEKVSNSSTAFALQRKGLIEYHRGDIQILNHAKLEATACSCYERPPELAGGGSC